MGCKEREVSIVVSVFSTRSEQLIGPYDSDPELLEVSVTECVASPRKRVTAQAPETKPYHL